MLIAFATSITLLPALLTRAQSAGEAAAAGLPSLAPVDRFMERHRISDHRGTGARRRSPGCRCSTCCSSTSIRSICATRNRSRSPPILDLRPRSGDSAPMRSDVVTPSSPQAREIAGAPRQVTRSRARPDAGKLRARTTSRPSSDLIRQAAMRRWTASYGLNRASAPSDAENIAALRAAAGAVADACLRTQRREFCPTAHRRIGCATDLSKLADGDGGPARGKAQEVFRRRPA